MGDRERNGLSQLLVRSTVVGFGASAGRDVYRYSKKNFLLLAGLAIVFAGTGYAVWDMVRANRRGPAGTIFRTVLLNIGIIGLSFMATVLIAGMMSDNRPEQALGIVAVVQGGSAFVGLTVGLINRRPRVRAFRIQQANERFLRDNGLRDVGGREQTMIDAAGNELQLQDIREDAIVFRVSGRRGGRAMIRLDESGRMIEYAAPAA